MTEPSYAHPQSTKVVVSTLFPQVVDGEFFQSWDSMRAFDALNSRHLFDGGGTIVTSCGPRVAEGRSAICEAFVLDFPLADWLLMVDSDMSDWDGDTLYALLDSAYATIDELSGDHAKVVGAFCIAGGRSRQYPTIYEASQPDPNLPAVPVAVNDPARIPTSGMTRVFATGAAFLLVHRDVIVKMQQAFARDSRTGKTNPYPWFVDGVNHLDGKSYGEDITFCIRAQAIGYGVYVNCGIEVEHRKYHGMNRRTWLDSLKPPAAHTQPAHMNRAERRRLERQKG